MTPYVCLFHVEEIISRWFVALSTDRVLPPHYVYGDTSMEGPFSCFPHVLCFPAPTSPTRFAIDKSNETRRTIAKASFDATLIVV